VLLKAHMGVQQTDSLGLPIEWSNFHEHQLTNIRFDKKVANALAYLCVEFSATKKVLWHYHVFDYWFWVNSSRGNGIDVFGFDIFNHLSSYHLQNWLSITRKDFFPLCLSFSLLMNLFLTLLFFLFRFPSLTSSSFLHPFLILSLSFLLPFIFSLSLSPCLFQSLFCIYLSFPVSLLYLSHSIFL